jgi:hypothetical protein
MKNPLPLLATTFLFSCSILVPSADTDYDAQFFQIFFHYNKFDELDTFRGAYQKDLVPGTATTTMWLTQREQENILTNVERAGFFSLPDTVHREPNVYVSPDFGAQAIRIKYRDKDKTVVWYDPMDPRSQARSRIDYLRRLLYDITVSKPEYKALPPAKAIYL